MFWKSKEQKEAEKRELIEQVKTEWLNEQKEEAANEEPKDNSEPWIDVRGEPDDQGRIRLQVDWNDAFIELLRSNGFNGANEDIIIQQYLTVMHRQLMDQNVGEGHFDG